MKKIVIAVVVVVIALLVAPWGVGKLAEKRLNVGLDKLVEQAPYLKVVDRKWTGGWFKSEQVVTFEAFSSWIDAMNPKAIEDAMKKDAAGAATAVEAPVEPAVVASPEAVPPSDPPTEEAPAVVKPEMMRFTVRNEVWHGPVLGLSGLGIARVKTHLVLSEETQKKIVEIFGPKDPLEIVTRVGFTGGGTTTFKSEGRTIKPDDKSEISWETFKLAVGYSRNADKYDMDGKWPKVEVRSLADKSQFVMTDMTLDAVGKRISGDLYDSDFTFGIDKLSMLGGDGQRIEVAKVHYILETEAKDEFMEARAQMGSGEVASKELSSLGIELKEIHYDFSVRRLHIQTLAKMLAGMKAAYSKPLTNALELNKVIFAPFKEQGVELLKYDPVFSIDRVGIVTPEGDGYLKGVITLKGVTAADFSGSSMALIGKIHADLTIDVSEKMVQKFPNGSTAAGAAVDSGYAQRKGDRLICKILFVNGALTVNGKPQAIPGLGGPPAESAGEAVRPAE
jgi:uncharacterized protein YdgA (DUF945 family)